MQRGQAHGPGAKLFIFFDVSDGRTWKDFLASGREGRWETQQRSSLKLKQLWNKVRMRNCCEWSWYSLKNLSETLRTKELSCSC